MSNGAEICKGTGKTGKMGHNHSILREKRQYLGKRDNVSDCSYLLQLPFGSYDGNCLLLIPARILPLITDSTCHM